MSIAMGIITFAGGIIAATLLRSWMLRRRVSEPIASGLAFYVVSLAQYPLMQATGFTLTFMTWAIWCALVIAVFMVIFAGSRSK